MAFDPVIHLTLKYSGRSAAVFRELCIHHEVSYTDGLHWHAFAFQSPPGQSLLAVAQRTFPSLQSSSTDDVVLMAPIPGFANTEPVELSPKIWNTVCHVVRTVTIALKSGILCTVP